MDSSSKPTWLRFINPTFMLQMQGQVAYAEAASTTTITPDTEKPYKSKRKPCCVCKMTKRLRDQCIRTNDDEDVCFEFVDAHKQCLRAKGFRVD